MTTEMDIIGGRVGVGQGIEQRDFEYKGLSCSEILVRNWGGRDKHKLLWCRRSILNIVVDGTPNPLTHVDFTDDVSGLYLEAARRSVQREFCRHYGLNTFMIDDTVLMASMRPVPFEGDGLPNYNWTKPAPPPRAPDCACAMVDITTIQWEVDGGIELNYKVLVTFAPIEKLSVPPVPVIEQNNWDGIADEPVYVKAKD